MSCTSLPLVGPFIQALRAKAASQGSRRVTYVVSPAAGPAQVWMVLMAGNADKRPAFVTHVVDRFATLYRLESVVAPQRTLALHRLNPAFCASLTGSGCSERDGGDDFTGSEACCGSGVRSSGRVCSADVGAPCVITDGERMKNGFACRIGGIAVFSMMMWPLLRDDSMIALRDQTQQHIYGGTGLQR